MPDIQLNELVEVNPLRPTTGLNPTDEVSFIPMSDVSESGRWVNHQSRQFGDVSRGYTYFEEGDVLFAKITPCMENGKGCYPRNLANGIGFASTEFHVIRAKDNADAGFIYQWSISKPLRLKASAIMTGSAGQQRVPASFLESFKVPAIAKPAQIKIAEILSTVDQAIDQTEALIAKQQRIKTGLMHDLLTRGIDENGNLRSEETHEFKDSPLGRIPVEWDLSELAYAFAEVPRNGIYKPPNQIGSGTVLIGQTSFTKEGRIDYRFARRTVVSPSELKAYQLRNHDILVRRVFATVDGVGLPILVTDLPEAAVYESNMLRLRVDSTKYNPTLLFHWLSSSTIRKRVTASVNASNQTSINQTVLNALPALVIPSDEQDNIVAAISTQETHLNDLARNLGKLRSLKTALMQDLLTGKVSVAPLLTDLT